MNAVLELKTTTIDALHAHRARMRAIAAEAEPLHEQASTLVSNIALTALEETATGREIERLRNAAAPDYSLVAAQEAKLRAISARLSVLRGREQKLRQDIAAVEGKVAPAHVELALQHAVLSERLEASVLRKREAESRFAAAVDEVEAHVLACDLIADEYGRHPGAAPIARYLGELRAARQAEANRLRNDALREVPRSHIQARAAEIRKEIEQA